MSQQPLILPGTATPSSQWRAQIMQLVNWGGFHGVNTVEFASTATLISGASGTGKSTLLDAYLALMMPSDTPFNGASNDAISGRARSADQRNLISYLRGKTDDSREAGTGEFRDQVLRGADGSTWGAIAMTFVNDGGQRFTAMRLYFVPRAATKFADMTMKLATFDGYLDLANVEDLVAARFDKRAFQSRFPGGQMHDSYLRFAQTLYSRLGIGANGDGSKALRLLARIQAGHQIRTVDDLYKTMVLEPPATFAAADRAVEHFADLEAAYEAMQTEADKEKALSRLPDLHADLTGALQASELIDTFGITRGGDSPWTLWCYRTEGSLLDAAVATNRQARSDARQEHLSAAAEESRLENLLGDIRQQQDAAGGSVIKRLDEDIDRLVRDRDQAVGARDVFDRQTGVLDLVIDHEPDLATAQSAARHFLDAFDGELSALTSNQKDLLGKQWPLSHEKTELLEEHASLQGRDGRVPKPLHDARVQIAQAAGIDPAALSFVAELIDVPPEEARWRKAVEVILYGLVRVLLVDVAQLEHVSRSIDPIRMTTRVNFEGVPTSEHQDISGDPQRISGKLQYKPSPFSRWVQDRIRHDSTDAICVESPSDLSGPGRRVTVNGQTRSGRSGSHGEYNSPNIIGFSNSERLSEIDERLADLEAQLGKLDTQLAELTHQIGHLHAMKAAHQRVLDANWKQIDVAGIDKEIDDLAAQRQRILESNDTLATLQQEEATTDEALTEARRIKFASDALFKHLEGEWSEMVDRQDHVAAACERIDRDQASALTEEQAAHLNDEFSKVADIGDLAGFPVGLTRLKSRLAERSKEEREKIRRLSDSMTSIFSNYQDRWPDPNLGTGVASYDGYRDILDTIVATGLYERRQEWSRRLAEWSGQDLVPLAGAFGSSIEEIEERLLPVNEILAALSFGAKRHHLKIDLRRLHKVDIVKFQKELRLLSSGSTNDLPDTEIESRFRRLRRFINLIRPGEAGKANSTGREYYLDVRKHVVITAIAVDDEGVERSSYAAIGGKSGGETQELVAFIVGAALRFQLGDEANAHPTFAPVFLDEGFVKSDSEFAGRAVSAWKGLGFQLIIGAPLDKVTALEPHVEKLLTITKGSRGYAHVTELSSPSATS